MGKLIKHSRMSLDVTDALCTDMFYPAEPVDQAMTQALELANRVLNGYESAHQAAQRFIKEYGHE